MRFLNWIPLGYIFETKLVSSLIYKVVWQYSGGAMLKGSELICFFCCLLPQFLNVPAFRNVTLKCLTEIGTAGFLFGGGGGGKRGIKKF